MGANGVLKRPRVRRGCGAWLRMADEVCVYSRGLGFVTVTKRVGRDILRRQRDRVTADWVPELGLLLITPIKF